MLLISTTASFHRLVFLLNEQAKIVSEQQMIFKLTRRSHRNLQKALELDVSVATTTFSKIGRYTCRTSANLGR